MIAFRTLLIILLIILLGYTGVAIANDGLQVANTFFGDIAVMGWRGQFNLDFMFMLILCALWIAWRHQFSGIGILFSVMTLVLGCLFLTTYLLILSWQTNGNMKEVLLGKVRVQENSNGA